MRLNAVRVTLVMLCVMVGFDLEIYKSSYEGLTEEQISAMTFDELEQSEHNRMKHNAFKVCEELTYQIDGATAPGGFMKAYTSQDSDDLFFNNHNHLKAFLSTTDIKGDKKNNALVLIISLC